MDLTKITTPFGLLDKETQEALKAHGGPYEMYDGPHWLDWSPMWTDASTYRVKPQPVTKPSIDWSHVAPQFRWLARDEDGYTWLYDQKPELVKQGLGEGYWVFSGDCCLRVSAFASFDPGTCDWKDSLVERPS